MATTYVMGYWYIDTNKKRNWDHYEKLLPQTFDVLKDCNIVFFYNNDAFLKLIKKYVKTKNIIYIRRNIIHLRTFKISAHYLKSCKRQNNIKLRQIMRTRYKNQNISYGEKGLTHYMREYKKGGDMNFRKMFTVWTSKLYCIKEIINKNPFKSNNFVWCDISISRCNRQSHLLTSPFSYDDKKIHFFNDNLMKFYGNPIGFFAGFMFAHKDTWNKFLPIYTRFLLRFKNSNYAHDEETLLNIIRKKYPQYFQPILPANPH